jgi:hypothetical protein
MLELRPNCEYCDRNLAPDSDDARICSYECTFCRQCAELVLHNVCPNCGGGFVPRPIRPVNAHRSGTGLAFQPASSKRVRLHHERADIEQFVAQLRAIPPLQR